MNPQLGNLLMQTGGQMLMQPQQPLQPQGAPPQQQPSSGGMNPQQAMQLIAQFTQQAQSEDDLLNRLAASGEPPATSMRPSVQFPQTVQAPPSGPVPVGLPKIPQTRGEAQTNPSLGSYLV